MGDVALLVDPVKQVGHRSHGPDTNVVSAVSFRPDGLSRGLEVGVVRCLVSSKRKSLYVSPVPRSRRGVQLLKPGPVTCSVIVSSQLTSDTEEDTLYRNSG